MGYYMFAYGVKTSELQAVFSSKNEALLAEVQKDEIFQNYAEEDDDNETTKALTDIIMGLPFDEKKRIYLWIRLYWYLCYFGKEAPLYRRNKVLV